MDKLNIRLKESDGSIGEKLKEAAIYVVEHLEEDPVHYDIGIGEQTFHLQWRDGNLICSIGDEEDGTLCYVISLFSGTERLACRKPDSKEECVKILNTYCKNLSSTGCK